MKNKSAEIYFPKDSGKNDFYNYFTGFHEKRKVKLKKQSYEFKSTSF